MERRLGIWLESTRYRSRKGTLGWTTERGEFLDEVAPGWLGDDDVSWRAIADEVAAFRLEHRRWPRSRVEDPSERRLGQWIRQMRDRSARGTGGWTEARGTYLNTVAPGWLGNDDPRWRAVADEVASFHNRHGRWPRSTAGDGHERRLARWLVQTRMYRTRNSNGWTPARNDYLNTVAPDWHGRA